MKSFLKIVRNFKHAFIFKQSFSYLLNLMILVISLVLNEISYHSLSSFILHTAAATGVRDHVSAHRDRIPVAMACALAEPNIKLFAFADSFLSLHNLESELYIKSENSEIRDTIIINPHKNNSDDRVRFTNRAVGGNTMNRVLSSYGALKEWGETQPDVTILHLGSVDIANESIGRSHSIKVEFRDKVYNFINELKRAAEAEISEEKRQSFRAKMKTHFFLFIGIPDWGPFGVGKYPNSLSSSEHLTARRKCNKIMKENWYYLWRDYRTVYFVPNLGDAERLPRNVHLHGPTKKSYGDQIFSVASKLLCTTCSANLEQLSVKNLEQELKHDALLATGCAAAHE